MNATQKAELLAAFATVKVDDAKLSHILDLLVSNFVDTDTALVATNTAATALTTRMTAAETAATALTARVHTLDGL